MNAAAGMWQKLTPTTNANNDQNPIEQSDNTNTIKKLNGMISTGDCIKPR